MSATAQSQSESATGTDVVEVGRRYFAAVNEHDIEAMLACWHPDGEEVISNQLYRLPDEFRAFFNEMFGAVPDLRIEPLDEVVADDRYILRYRATGTFAGPGTLQGFEPTGSRLELVGLDMLRIEDGLIRRNDAFVDGQQMAEGLGVMPPQESPQAQRMAGLINRRTRLMRRMTLEPERVADGVWLVRGGFPIRSMNVYLIEDDGGVALYDAGIKAMTGGLAMAASRMGGITRVILGHAHADHRGAAAGLGAPVFCHGTEVPLAEGNGGYDSFDFSKLKPPARLLMKRMLPWWDGGPVKVAGTLAEGDEVLGFRVVPTPGHSPGQIALFRESDRLALTSDTFYTIDPETLMKGEARVPHPAFTPDIETARASIRRIAELEPSAAWPGHADPVTGDVRSALERAAAA